MDILNPTVIRSKRKTISLEVKTDASLIIRAPLFVSEEKIYNLFRQKKPWIERTVKKMLCRKNEIPRKVFSEGEDFFFLGKAYRLRVSETGQDEIRIEEDSLVVSRKYLDNPRPVFLQWYYRQAARIFHERTVWFSSSARVACRSIRISQGRTKWGSCAGLGNLTFNWRLVMAPLHIIDYVVAHEVAHIHERNHSRRFWKKVSELFPEYEVCKKWLRDNGHRLNI